ncbi:MAG: thermonuclease family protein [Pseudomonadota bacterium]
MHLLLSMQNAFLFRKGALCVCFWQNDRMKNAVRIIAVLFIGAALFKYNWPTVYWADGDSGRWNGIEFRLADVDAPETSPVGSAVGPAKCDLERARGLAAEKWIKDYTKDKPARVVGLAGFDRYNRLVVRMSAGGEDLSALGVEHGHLREWKWVKGRPLNEKPDWCQK